VLGVNLDLKEYEVRRENREEQVLVVFRVYLVKKAIVGSKVRLEILEFPD
jgi:hypothetical protein